MTERPPRRSVLSLTGSHPRVLDRAPTLPGDAVMLDREEADRPATAEAGPDAIPVPEPNGRDALAAVVAAPSLRVWVMIESPLVLLHLGVIAGTMLIHPAQIATADAVLGPHPDEIAGRRTAAADTVAARRP